MELCQLKNIGFFHFTAFTKKCDFMYKISGMSVQRFSVHLTIDCVTDVSDYFFFSFLYCVCCWWTKTEQRTVERATSWRFVICVVFFMCVCVREFGNVCEVRTCKNRTMYGCTMRTVCEMDGDLVFRLNWSAFAGTIVK